MRFITCQTSLMLLFLIFVACFGTGYIGDDDIKYVNGAYGWLNAFPYLGGHGSVRSTITVPLAFLFYWFGENEFTLILPALIAGTGIIATSLVLIQSIFSSTISVITGVVLTSTPLLVFYSGVLYADIIEAFFILTSLYSFYISLYSKYSKSFLILSGFLCGFAFITRETSVFLVFLYFLLFLSNFGTKRQNYFYIFYGFASVVMAEVIYLWIMSGNPFYRIEIALNHDSRIDRAQNQGGLNIIVHPLIDPYIMPFTNQEFGLVFISALPLMAYLYRQQCRNVSDCQSNFLLLISGLGCVWFVCSASSYNYLMLIPRYFLVSAVCVSLLVGIALGQLYDKNRKAVVLFTLTSIVVINFLCLCVTHYVTPAFTFGPHNLVEFATKKDATIFTDKDTYYRSKVLLRFKNVKEKVKTGKPVPGSFYYRNHNKNYRSYPVQPEWHVVEHKEYSPGVADLLIAYSGMDNILKKYNDNYINNDAAKITLYKVPLSEKQ
jgi:hypothetical protein